MNVAAEGLIDVHAHVVLEGVFGAAGSYGPELLENETGEPVFRAGDYILRDVRYQGSVFMDIRARLAAMDAAGIALQVLSPNPITLFHSVESEIAVAFCRRHNELLAGLVATNPKRLRALAALPMQDVKAAIDELHRAVKTHGMSGAAIGVDVGRQLDDPALDEFYAAVIDLDVPLFIHPAPNGSDGGWIDRRLERWDLALVAGFARDETLAALTLIFGGVLERHASLDICLSHGGGAFPFLLGRARAAARRPWAAEWVQSEGSFDAFVERLWFDVHVGSEAALACLLAVVSPERVVYGSNFGGWDQPTGNHGRPSMELSQRLNNNARSLLRL